MGVHRSPDDPPLEIFAPALRILPSYWGYDPETGTTFTSDSFTHATLDDPSAPPVIADRRSDTVTDTTVRAYLEAAFWWLPLADSKSLIAEQIREADEDPLGLKPLETKQTWELIAAKIIVELEKDRITI